MSRNTRTKEEQREEGVSQLDAGMQSESGATEATEKLSDVGSAVTGTAAQEIPGADSPAPEPTAQLIYLGPNLPGGRLLQSTVFRGGIPAYLLPLMDERPEVRTLTVPLGEMSDVQARIVRTGTAEFIAYQALLPKREEE